MPSPSSSSAAENDLDYGPTLRGFREGLKVFGRYELIRMLGRGGMGVVWLARDTKLDLRMALKFLPEHLVHDEVALDDLRRETRRCLKLTHQNIVHVYDLVDDEATAAIAMEYVEGRTLSALRLDKPNRVFEPAEILPWLLQVCEALEYAHTKAKIVHHDLKPGNLMLTSEGHIKVMDFGIASTLGDSMSRVSKVGQEQRSGGGTLPYMSPQQVMGHPPHVSDDVYSLGATIYELLTGKPPFFRGDLMRQIESITPPPIITRRAELGVEGGAPLPEAWEQVVAACLEKVVEKRPQGARELLRELGQQRIRPAAAPSTVAPSVPATGHTAPHPPGGHSPAATRRKSPSWVRPLFTVAIIAISGFNLWLRYKRARIPESRPEASARDILSDQEKWPQKEQKSQTTAQDPRANLQSPGATSDMSSHSDYLPYLQSHSSELAALFVAPVSSGGNLFERQAEGEAFANAVPMMQLRRTAFSSDLAAMAITKSMTDNFVFLCCEVRSNQLCLSLMDIGDGVFEALETVSLPYSPNFKDDAINQMKAYLQSREKRLSSARINFHAVVPARPELEGLLIPLSRLMPGERLSWSSSTPAAIAGAKIQSAVLGGTEQDTLLLTCTPHAFSVHFPNGEEIEAIRPYCTVPCKAAVEASWIPEPSNAQQIMLREMIGPAGTSAASTPVRSLPLPPDLKAVAGKPVTVRAIVKLDANHVLHFSLEAVDRSLFTSLEKARPGDTRQIEVSAGVALKLFYVQRSEKSLSGFWLAAEDCNWEQWGSLMLPNEVARPGKPAKNTLSAEDLAEFVNRLNTRFQPPPGWEWNWPSDVQWEQARQMTSEFSSLGLEQLAGTQYQPEAGLRPVLQPKVP